ncbi:MAG: M20/M25/M40 family metallo-hydrolase [Oscillospiraceae bacterium]
MIEDLKALCSAIGVSGLESTASMVAADFLKKYTNEVVIDDFYNDYGIIKSKNKDAKTIMLDAHIDEIGMIVTYIDEKGYVKVSSCGGIDSRLLAAQELTIHSKKGDVIGVVGSKPPHLEKDEDKDKISTVDEIFIDIGMSKSKAEECVKPGDRVTINAKFTTLLNGRIATKALDDRAGVVAILQTLKLLENKDLDCNLVVLFSSQEETGLAGATISSFKLEPDIALAVDVSFAYTSDAIEHKCGKMGKGAMIGISPALNKNISDCLINIAKNKDIPYQLEVMGGGETGTNADAITLSKNGVKTGVVSIPLKYMHTPVESIDTADIESCARLLSEFLLSGGNIC